MIPEKMKAIVITKPNEAVVREFTTPEPRMGEILIRVKKVLICTWEQRIFAGADMALPFIPGHEIAGTVAKIGPDTDTDVKIGDRVVVKTYDNCGHCENCYRGFDNLCTGKKTQRSYDGVPGTGGFAQYLAIGADRVYPIPGDAGSLEEAAFAEPVACVLNSISQASVEMGEDVVIVGGGIMGQLHNVLAKLCGARTILIEPDASRRAMAKAQGADEVIDPLEKDPVSEINKLTNGHGAHVCFFTVNVLKLAGDYLEALAKHGRIVYYGSFHPSGTIPVDPNKIHYSEKKLTGAYSPTRKGFWTASRLLGYQLLQVAPFITERYSMDDCQKAFERAGSAETYRVLIDLE